MFLKTTSRMFSTLALIATATLLSTGAASALPQSSTTTPTTVQASAPAPAIVRMPVIGLTSTNMEKVQAALAGLKEEVWVCPGCKAVKQTKAHCSACNMDLVAEKRALVTNVTPKVDNGVLAFSVSEGMAVKLSVAKQALSSFGVNIDENKLGIPTGAVLHVRGSVAIDAQKTQTTLKTALVKPELFQNVMVAQTPGTTDYVVKVEAGDKAPKQVAVAGAIKDAGFELMDLSYTNPAYPAASKPLGGGQKKRG